MANIQQLRCFYVCNVSMNSFNPIRSLENYWSARSGSNTGRNCNSHWSSTTCNFQDLKQVLVQKCRPKIGPGSQTCNNAQQRSLYNNNGLKTPKHECHSSSTAPSFGYRYQNFDISCPKPLSRCSPVCLPTNGVCQVNSKSPSSSQEVGDRECTQDK